MTQSRDCSENFYKVAFFLVERVLLSDSVKRKKALAGGRVFWKYKTKLSWVKINFRGQASDDISIRLNGKSCRAGNANRVPMDSAELSNSDPPIESQTNPNP